MQHYSIQFSRMAKADMQNLYDYIIATYKSYKTANNYQRGLLGVVNQLKRSAGSHQISTQQTVLSYGWNARRVNYKKMTVIFTIYENIVLIHRVMPASMIIEK
jgi:plasmid stabilization system protein ParE